MTRVDQQIFYTALAYIAIYLKAPDQAYKTEPAIILAAHIEEYCRKNIENAFPPVEIRFVNDAGIDDVDRIIDHHVTELRDSEITILPQDKETLLKFYDRLQQRRSRRMQAAFYEKVNVEVLANNVLHYIEEEVRALESDA